MAASARRGVSLGFTEGTPASVGCLWNSNILIGSDGAIINHHRKLVPTFYEKLVWANGDGRGLRVVETEIGRLGMLICGENTNPLARYALMAQGEQVHMSSYPPIWPTRPANQKGAYDLRRAIEIRAGSHAFEAKVFNVVASAAVDGSMRERLAHLDRMALDTLAAAPRAVSMIIDPSGDVISDVLAEDEGIVYAEIDIARCVEPKQFHDVVGYYNRFDIFRPDGRSHAAQSGGVHRGGDRSGAGRYRRRAPRPRLLPAGPTAATSAEAPSACRPSRAYGGPRVGIVGSCRLSSRLARSASERRMRWVQSPVAMARLALLVVLVFVPPTICDARPIAGVPRALPRCRSVSPLDPCCRAGQNI